ncbi:ribitol-5-phosphate 2-dehydrogenase [Methanobrevibacter gottschalkii]|uniref:Ribitol-5-phosphate 2-dehydrogenase n=2 Tax=Methanobrevibacter gottschalkii TaxID=190974 RepID=A0A3N5AZ33_9EURY|nr:MULTISPECIES: alcohol dehydrogenase catalytic domain-containing protein [Methanobrevibacter]MCQ2970404.1 alcohol dehydrogenase catalytic domain-containing protein [archaeon]OED01025.1 ribitol-5-phosphate dehydrogenase [Methanobrevibacter sp. A27]RPF50219.1 ribitol-5-phosphate 2-dehydrogenase [Methanobrevibacter gottschalkii DSM 11977]SEL13225.1 ribitol-5-phosphate 2-dehydrogenase [Methanobrevibacter gottschalkii]
MINIVYRLKSPKFFEEAIDEIELEGVIVRPTYLSICQADQRYYQGSRPAEILEKKLPMALIHEGIGEVVFDESGKLKSGDKVVMIPNTPEGKDVYRANYSYDSKFRGSGFDGFTSDLIKLQSDRVVKIPNEFNPHVAAFIELMTVSYQGISRFSEIAITPKDVLGVWGDGNLGFITALFLKEKFPESKVYVFGKHLENLNLFSFADGIYQIHNVPKDLLIDHAFECVGSSASQSAIEQIIDLINPQGSINLFGVSEYPIPLNTRMVLEKGLTIQGNSRSEREDFVGVVETLKQNPKLFEYLGKLVTNICEINSLNDLKESFDKDYISNFGKTILKWDK